MDSIVIVSAARTPLGAFNGNFKNVPTTSLGGVVIKEVTKNIQDKISNVYMGCVLSAGLGQSAARQSAILAGLNPSVNCCNINKICGSGMAAIMLGRNSIIAGENEIVVAGGMENMSRAPYLLTQARSGYRLGNSQIIDHMVHDGLTDAYTQLHMGLHAESAADKYAITREEQDEYTMKSFGKARNASDSELFNDEIVPVPVKDRKGVETLIDKDEVPFSVDLSKMPKLKPVFKSDGTITAASASSISDGAAAVVIMKESMAEKYGLAPLARIVAQSSFSQSPELFATAPIGAIRQILDKTGWKIQDIDLFEINEAFAVVAMAAIKEFSIEPDRVNIFGGACALGHPIGASGARIVVTLLNAMKKKSVKRGLATLCVGGGEAVAMAFENMM